MSFKNCRQNRKQRPEGPTVHDEPDPPRDATGQLLMFTDCPPLAAQIDALEKDIETTLLVDEEEAV